MEFFDPKKVQFPFVKSFKFFVPLSLILLVTCLFLMFVSPGFKYGIDFRGGVEATINFKDPNVDTAALRTAMEGKIPGLSIVEAQGGVTKAGYTREYLVTGLSEQKEDLSKKFGSLLEKFGTKDQDWTISKLDSVGPKVGGELRKAAMWSLIYTALLITLYMYVRFDMRYSPGAIVGVIHDLVFTCGFLVLTGTEMSTNVVAALLTLAGYSINDTVIVFDRIREVEHTSLGKSRAWVVDHAINSTLARTINTSATTLVTLLVLLFVGGPTLRDFSLTLFFGVLVGTYSSSFVASPLYLWCDKYFSSDAKKTKTPTGKMKPAKA